MKNHLKMIPVVVYPYIYMLCFILLFVVGGVINSDFVNAYAPLILVGLGAICNIYAFVIVIYYIVMAAGGKYSGKELIKLTMIIKLVQIPAYIIHLILGLVGLILGIFGIGFIIWAILIDLISIVLSGFVGISAGISCCKDKTLSTDRAVLYSILGFIYCVDVISAVVFYFKVRHLDK